MKTILLIYYNQNLSSFYFRSCDPIDLLISDRVVGYKNSYGHELISILYFISDTYVPINSYSDYRIIYNTSLHHKSFRNGLIDRGIRLLNKLKK